MTRRLFQYSPMMQNTSHVAVRHIRIDSAFFQDFQVVQREKATVRTHLSRWLATLALHPVHHGHQQPVVVQFPTDLLRYDQMIVAHRQRRCVAQRESRRSGRKRLSASVRESFRIPDFFSRCNCTGISRSGPASFSIAACAPPPARLLPSGLRSHIVAATAECSCGSWRVPRAASLCYPCNWSPRSPQCAWSRWLRAPAFPAPASAPTGMTVLEPVRLVYRQADGWIGIGRRRVRRNRQLRRARNQDVQRQAR